MARFTALKVTDVRKETKDTVSVALEVPADRKADFDFKPGHYLTLRIDLNGEEVRRSYSICSAPHEDELRVAIKKVEGGLFSTFANDLLKVGDTIESMTPMGTFVRSVETPKHIVGFAAGSGITPVISIIKDVMESSDDISFTLFYGNRSFSSIIFREALEALKNKYMSRFTLHHILSGEDLGSPLFTGRMDHEKIASFFDHLIDFEDVDEYFICGPEGMIHAAREVLEAKGAEKKKVHFELFTSPLGKLNQQAPKSTTPKVASTDKKDCTVKVILDGDAFEFDLSSEGTNILDAALVLGADLPFACKGGVCCTCKAKLIEGEVDMEVNYALEEEEVEAGFILTCQAHPTSDRVVVDFDQL